MFIDKDKRRVSQATIDAPYIDADGTQHPALWLRNPINQAKVGITEIADPGAPEDFSDDVYYRTEQDTEPYVVYTRKPEEQITQAINSKLDQQIDAIERQAIMPRGTREALKAIMEAQAAAGGLTPEQLYKANIGYKKLVDLDTEIKSLRGKKK